MSSDRCVTQRGATGRRRACARLGEIWLGHFTIRESSGEADHLPVAHPVRSVATTHGRFAPARAGASRGDVDEDGRLLDNYDVGVVGSRPVSSRRDHRVEVAAACQPGPAGFVDGGDRAPGTEAPIDDDDGAIKLVRI